MHTRGASLGPGYLNVLLRRTSAMIAATGDRVLQQASCVVPSHATAIMAIVDQNEGIPIRGVADALGYAHQSVATTVADLVASGLLVSAPCQVDKRQRRLRLTKKGKAEMAKIQVVAQGAKAALDELFDEMDCNLFEALVKFEEALERRTLADRVAAQLEPPAEAAR